MYRIKLFRKVPINPNIGLNAHAEAIRWSDFFFSKLELELFPALILITNTRRRTHNLAIERILLKPSLYCLLFDLFVMINKNIRGGLIIYQLLGWIMMKPGNVFLHETICNNITVKGQFHWWMLLFSKVFRKWKSILVMKGNKITIIIKFKSKFLVPNLDLTLGILGMKLGRDFVLRLVIRSQSKRDLFICWVSFYVKHMTRDTKVLGNVNQNIIY